FFRLREFTGRLDHQLRADRLPVNGRRVFFGKHLDGFAVHADGVTGGPDVVLQVPEDGIVFEQMGQGGWAGEVVDRHKVEVMIVESGTEHVASDAAKAVNANSDCHGILLLQREGRALCNAISVRKSVTLARVHWIETNQVSRGTKRRANLRSGGGAGSTFR